MRNTLAVSLFCALALTGCGEDVELDATLARACLFEQGTMPSLNTLRDSMPPEETTTLAPDVPLSVAVTFAECGGDAWEATCEATVEGQTLRVTADGHRETGGLGSSTEECAIVTAFCETPPLAAGEWTFVYAPTGASQPVTIPPTPTAVAVPCQ